MKEELRRILKRFSEQRIGVIGDFVADEYILGMTSRVSREAPVIVLKYDSQIIVPGGGANSVNNINSLGGKVFPIGVVGDDEQGARLLAIMKDKGIDVSGILKDSDRVTPTKTRILAGGHNTTKQQVIRIDREKNNSLDKKIEREILGIIESKTDDLDALLVSDYSLGTLTEDIIGRINEMQSREKIVTIDSRYNILKFKNVTAVTPNVEEIEWLLKSLSNEYDINKGCAELLKKINSNGILLTKGKEGMTLYESSGKKTDIGIYGTDEIADVTGAGDTVISTFTLALAGGAAMIEAANMANYAGGIVVMKTGTATVTVQEIEEAIDKDGKNKNPE